jgi:hypothetical protein
VLRLRFRFLPFRRGSVQHPNQTKGERRASPHDLVFYIHVYSILFRTYSLYYTLESETQRNDYDERHINSHTETLLFRLPSNIPGFP